MSYPKIPDYSSLVDKLSLYSQLKHEYGASQIEPILIKAEGALINILNELRSLPIDPEIATKEPNDLNSIQSLRPEGPRQLWGKFNKRQYQDKLEGALLGRMAGCTLGAPVEFWPIERMEALAHELSSSFPPKDYWSYIPHPYEKRYGISPNESYTKDKMDGVPVDDDLAYTLLGLLVIEEYGSSFTTEEIGKSWLKYLPYACSAEDVALKNLKAGVQAFESGDKNNPYCEWIGADIRADPWGYLAPAWPERAAEMAYRDAYISHRRQGIYGEMYFAAVISAAFTVKHPVEALEIGLTEIPKDCELAKAIRWALNVAPTIHDYRQARETVEDRFVGMSPVHTINNACLTIWGLTIGGNDFTRVIGETVAMGMDNDCTAATAGSIIGAILGKNLIPQHWVNKFNNTVHSYLIGKTNFKIDNLTRRFTKAAIRIYDEIN
jgi:ADP-ribosylglycohydrolase